MVLVRSENGQLLMIPQQALAQMQAQAHAQPQTTMAPRPATPTSAPPVQISTVQVSARVPWSVNSFPAQPLYPRMLGKPARARHSRGSEDWEVCAVSSPIQDGPGWHCSPLLLLVAGPCPAQRHQLLQPTEGLAEWGQSEQSRIGRPGPFPSLPMASPSCACPLICKVEIVLGLHWQDPTSAAWRLLRHQESWSLCVRVGLAAAVRGRMRATHTQNLVSLQGRSS